MNEVHVISILVGIVVGVLLTTNVYASAYAATTLLAGNARICSGFYSCYFTITTSNGTGHVINTFMNATHTVTGVILYGTNTRHLVSEHVNSTSILVGKNINTIQLKLRAIGVPPGYFQVGVFDVNHYTKRLFGNVSASSLGSTYKVYTFTVGQNYTIVSDDYIGLFYNATGSSSANSISIMRDNVTNFDGNNSQEQFYDTKWRKDGTFDLYMLLQNIGVQQPAWVRIGPAYGAVSFQLPGETNITSSSGFTGQSVRIGPVPMGSLYHITGNFSTTDINTGKIVNGSTSVIMSLTGHSGRGGGYSYRLISGSINVLETPKISHNTVTSVSCNPSSFSLASSTSCTAMVTNLAKQYAVVPTGTVSFSATNLGLGSFSPVSCTLSSGSCSVKFSSNEEYGPGTTTIYATYNGDKGHLTSLGSTLVYVTP